MLYSGKKPYPSCFKFATVFIALSSAAIQKFDQYYVRFLVDNNMSTNVEQHSSERPTLSDFMFPDINRI